MGDTVDSIPVAELIDFTFIVPTDDRIRHKVKEKSLEDEN